MCQMSDMRDSLKQTLSELSSQLVSSSQLSKCFSVFQLIVLVFRQVNRFGSVQATVFVAQ